MKLRDIKTGMIVKIVPFQRHQFSKKPSRLGTAKVVDKDQFGVTVQFDDGFEEFVDSNQVEFVDINLGEDKRAETRIKSQVKNLFENDDNEKSEKDDEDLELLLDDDSYEDVDKGWASWFSKLPELEALENYYYKGRIKGIAKYIEEKYRDKYPEGWTINEVETAIEQYFEPDKLTEGDSSIEQDNLFDKCQKSCDDSYEKCDASCEGDTKCEDNCADIYNQCGANCEDLDNIDEAVDKALKEAKDPKAPRVMNIKWKRGGVLGPRASKIPEDVFKEFIDQGRDDSVILSWLSRKFRGIPVSFEWTTFKGAPIKEAANYKWGNKNPKELFGQKNEQSKKNLNQLAKTIEEISGAASVGAYWSSDYSISVSSMPGTSIVSSIKRALQTFGVIKPQDVINEGQGDYSIDWPRSIKEQVEKISNDEISDIVQTVLQDHGSLDNVLDIVYDKIGHKIPKELHGRIIAIYNDHNETPAFVPKKKRSPVYFTADDVFPKGYRGEKKIKEWKETGEPDINDVDDEETQRKEDDDSKMEHDEDRGKEECNECEEKKMNKKLKNEVKKIFSEQVTHRGRTETALVNGRKITRTQGTYNPQDPTAFTDYDLGDGYKLSDVTWGIELKKNGKRILYTENEKELNAKLSELNLPTIDLIEDVFHEVDAAYEEDPISKYYGFNESKKLKSEVKKLFQEDVEVNIPQRGDLAIAELSPQEKQEIVWTFAGECADVIEKMIESNVSIRGVYGYEVPRKAEVMHAKLFDFILAEIERA